MGIAALELNLGFPSHYTYLRSLAAFNPANQIELILFYTDDLELCLTRAKSRHLNGGHLVKPEVVEEMYRNTIPLFVENQALFQRVRLMDVRGTSITEYQREDKQLPVWISQQSLTTYLSEAKPQQKPKGLRRGL